MNIKYALLAALLICPQITFSMENKEKALIDLRAIYDRLWTKKSRKGLNPHMLGQGFGRAILDEEQDLNALNVMGETLMLAACRIGAWELVRQLIICGADVNYQRKEDGRTTNSVLHCVVIQGKAELVQLLLKHGAKIDSKNFHDQTPLMLVQARYENTRSNSLKEIIKILKRASAVETLDNSSNNNNNLITLAEMARIESELMIPVNRLVPSTYDSDDEAQYKKLFAGLAEDDDHSSESLSQLFKKRKIDTSE